MNFIVKFEIDDGYLVFIEYKTVKMYYYKQQNNRVKIPQNGKTYVL